MTMSRTLRSATVAALVGVCAASAAAQPERLTIDRGALGAWHALQRLRTFGSVLHTTAHPDDEHGGVLTWLSRGQGVRVSLLTLTRGEGGDNAIGPELFDALGLIRTEELLAANRYYGVDRQYFTSMVDYGFSKRLEEAWEKWDRRTLLGEVVAVLRTERPVVVLSRFQGAPRDGHGNHMAAGAITREAFLAAGDPEAFPDQIAAGLRPWQARKLYVGGVRDDEVATLTVDVGAVDPRIGMSYQRLARLGLSLQRSQNAGRASASPGSAVFRYARVDTPGPAIEATPFDGLDTSWAGVFSLVGQEATPNWGVRLTAIGDVVEAVARGFSMHRPADGAVALAAALDATRNAISDLAETSDARLLLERKAEQFEAAIGAMLGLELSAVAVSEDTPPAEIDELGPVVSGQTVQVDLALSGSGIADIEDVALSVETPDDWRVGESGRPVASDDRWQRRVEVRIGGTSATRPHFSRTSLAESRYRIEGDRAFFDPFPAPAARGVARFRVAGVVVEHRTPVVSREARLPYGYADRLLQVLPAIGLTISPAVAVVPLGVESAELTISVRVDRRGPAGCEATLELQLPEAWRVSPEQVRLRGGDGSEVTVDFRVRPSDLSGAPQRVGAVARLDGVEFREGYDTIVHRDLETRRLFRPAEAFIRGVDVVAPPDLRVGYVMGIGDAVPEAIGQLGATVQRLEADDLASADLNRFDAILVGTRAYAVRPDLHRSNDRLLAFAERGGHLIVLYNTQEFIPSRHAPFPGDLPRRSEEVSEEDAPVVMLAPDAPVLAWPNRITAADFDGWVEQRGSKFWRSWADAYTAVVESHDTGQPPQRGGWLTVAVGQGHYTYFAYALHRQLPSGVPGAYRLLANLLSVGRRE
ncbi:MAG: PIG-L family deacetylase [Vicinamibacterales bacterium]|nr:PIG-L family deacetylase [Vicinamibacterales bacterium]